MRSLLALLIVTAVAAAYILPTESLDVVYQARPDSVAVIGIDGRTLFTQQAIYPLIATDAAGRCFAVVNRPYIYQVVQQSQSLQFSAATTVTLTPDILDTLAQYGIRLPPQVPVVINFTIPLPPLLLVSLQRSTIVSLHRPYGYPLWAINLPKANATVVATDCRQVAVGTMAGQVYVVENGAVKFVVSLGSPITALAYSRDGSVLYAGTADGRTYSIQGASVARVADCAGSVYAIYTPPSGGPVALCFAKQAVPTLSIYPYGITLQNAVLTEYGIADVPRVPSSMSQDGSWLFVGTASELVAIRGGSVAWRYPLPAKASAVAASGDGSLVAVGTQAGHLIVLKDGVAVLRTDPVATLLLLRTLREGARNVTTAVENLQVSPITSVATSFDGRAAVFERWIDLTAINLATLPLSVDAPSECQPAEVAIALRGSPVAYIYSVSGRSSLLVPYGVVDIYPLYRYAGDFRCRPLYNLSLTIFGDVAEEARLAYIKEYRVTLSPPGLTRGPAWAAGPTLVYADPVAPVQAQVTIVGDVQAPAAEGITAEYIARQATAKLVGWTVDGQRAPLSLPTLPLDVRAPVNVAAIYRVILGRTYEGKNAGVRLVSVTVFDRAGNPVASGLEPEVSVNPIFATATYVVIYRVSAGYGATVNGTAQVWAEAGQTVVFQAQQTIDLGNGTRLVFQGWSGVQSTSPTVTLTVTGPLTVTPIYGREYRVVVQSPARVVQPPDAAWVPAGATVTIALPEVLQQGTGVRTVLDRWIINGRPANVTGFTISVKATGPTVVNYTTKRQYLVSFESRYGQVPSSMWMDEGSTLTLTPYPTEVWSPPPLHFVFAGWKDKNTGTTFQLPQRPVVYSSTTYEAVWNLDPIPLIVIAAAAGGVAALLIIRRRRARAIGPEMEAA